jgi:HD-GYP domain-containing protein (c-di-GMP phosphodiesterase class II)
MALPPPTRDADNQDPHLAVAAENHRLRAVLEAARALVSERNLDALLHLILREAVAVADADRGSLFLVDHERGELWSKIAHGLEPGAEIRVKLGMGVAGTCAANGEIINLTDAYSDQRFNQAVDRATGYHTRTLLCVPMTNMRGEVVGVVQLLNRRQGVFTAADADLLRVFGGQAAAAIENALLHEEITSLFEGFVKASVVAIESRDPTTGGHSERVAKLTLGLADSVERSGTGPLGRLVFDPNQRMEIRYAALLHDFGKVGVREDVLVKANKLYPAQLSLLKQRFEYAEKAWEAETLRRVLALIRSGADVAMIQAEEAKLLSRRAELDRDWGVIESANRPTVLSGGSFEALTEMQTRTYPAPDGSWQPLLTEQEAALLSIPRGSLSSQERAEIEAHVSHTFRFLSQIPWSRSLERVPEIAHGHHEKLSGQGYPLGLKADAICLEARMMSVADIYDALTASDRPYKKAVPHDNAVRILQEEVERGALDGDLVRLFTNDEVPRRVIGEVEFDRVNTGKISGVF